MNYKGQIPSIPFKQWIGKDTENRWCLLLSVAFSIVAFIWLKGQYPYPNFLPDSYSYLDAAFNNQNINTWPIGYSIFLRIFSSFTRSDTALVFVQYILLQACILYFLFTIRYWLSPGKWAFRILMVCCVANPLSLHVSNFVSSDALFSALSLIWFTQLLWIIFQPGIRILVVHAFVLAFAFMVRYNALYYPLISVALILLIRLTPVRKIIGIGCIILLVGGFIGKSIYNYRQLTGFAQFSAFGGWQMASNALFAYAHATPDPPESLPSKFKDLHAIVKRHMDSLNRLKIRPDQQLGIYYLWDEKAPLKAYFYEKWEKDTVTDEFKKWASMGPIYSSYGSWLILHHPVAFMKYYLWPNMINYYAPSAEFMNVYNMGKDTVDEIARFWFAYKTNKLEIKRSQISSVEIYPIFLAIINLLFACSFISVWFLGGFKKSSPYFSNALRWIGIIWLANFGFSVVASPVVLRYQVFPMIITLVFLGLLLEFIIRESVVSKNTNNTIDSYEDTENIAVGMHMRMH